MNLYHMIFTIIAVQAKNIVKYCDVSENDTNNCYIKETLLTMAHSPHQLAVDKETNTLYFSFDSGQGEYIPALYKIDTKQLSVLKGIKDAFAIAYDAEGKEVYFGGTHGIYKYNTKIKSLKHLNISNLDVWWLYVKRQVYFIKFPSLNLYSFENGSIKFFSELSNNVVHQMVIDVDDNKLFINSSGLYGVKPQDNVALLIKDSPRFLNMAADNYGFVYVCSEDGLYSVGKIIPKVKKIVHIHGVLGFTFDKHNNIIYSDSHEIVRLIPILKPNNN